MVVTESRTELLQWLNTMLDLNYTKIEQCGTGSAFCQLMDSIVGSVPLNKVKFNATTDYDFRHNWKILQSEFTKHKITKNIDVERLIKCRLQDNLDLLQWFKRYWNENNDFNSNYDSISKRKISASPHQTLKPVNNNSITNMTPNNNKASTLPLGSKDHHQLNQNHYSGNGNNKLNQLNNSNNNSPNNGISTNNYNGHSPNDFVSSNYTSSNMSNKIRPPKRSLTPSTSRITTPIHHKSSTSRKTSGNNNIHVEKRINSNNHNLAYNQNTIIDDLNNNRNHININNNNKLHDSAQYSSEITTGTTINGYSTQNNSNYQSSYYSDQQQLQQQPHHNDQNQNQHQKEIELLLNDYNQLNKEYNQLELNLKEIELNNETLHIQKNFYFNKCRDIEVLIQHLTSNNQNNTDIMNKIDLFTFMKKIEDILYATEEGFSSNSNSDEINFNNNSNNNDNDNLNLQTGGSISFNNNDINTNGSSNNQIDSDNMLDTNSF
ncbi:BIM1 [Candida jiufengensis]|uniref:BIM1 n=1 Tax=Candida jiufengensis TaxID=497108 RepID=UPI0022240F52|nr:BIM1 [Candida jiufengensis]KAI5951677.1 BIM1 [Candida jiufengensis]